MIVVDSKDSLLKSDDEEDLIFDHSTLLQKDVTFRESGYGCCPSGGKLQIAKTVNLCLSFFGLGLCFALPTATLNDLQTAVQANENIKNIYTARYSGYLFGAIIGGFLFDCYNRQFLLFLSLLATGIGIIIMPFCQELPALMACTAVTGITMGFLDTGGNVWCLDLWGRRSAPFMQALHFCFGLGAFVAPIVAEPFLSPLLGYHSISSLENDTFLNNSLVSVPRVGLPQYPLISGKHIIVKHSVGDTEYSIQFANEYELERTKRKANNETDWTNNSTEIFISPDFNSTEAFNKTPNSIGDSVIFPKPTVATTTTIKPKPKYADGNQLPKDEKWTKPQYKDGQPILPIDQSKASSSSTVSSTTVMSSISGNSTQESINSTSSSLNVTIGSSTVAESLKTDLNDTNENQENKTTEAPLNSNLATTSSNSNLANTSGNSNLATTSGNSNLATTSGKSNLATTPGSSNLATTSGIINPTTEAPAPSSTAIMDDKPTITTKFTDKILKIKDNNLQINATQNSSSKTYYPKTGPSFPAVLYGIHRDKVSSSTSTEPTTTTQTTATPFKEKVTVIKTVKPNVKITSTVFQNTQDTSTEPSTQHQTMKESTIGPTVLISQSKAKPGKVLSLVKGKTDEQSNLDLATTDNPVVTDNPAVIQRENVSETNNNLTTSWKNDFFSRFFNFLRKNRLGKFEIPYILLAIYIFFVSIVFLVFLYKNPREPRSMQLEESNKSRDLSLSFRVVMVGLMALFLCLYVGIQVGVGELLVTFATKENLQLPQSRGYFLPYIFWGSFATSRGVSIFVATRVTGRNMLTANLSICLVASIMLVAGADKLEALLWVGIVVLGFGMGPLFPTSISWLERYLHITNKTASIFVLGAAIGEIVIPIIVDLFINQEPMVLMYVNIIVNALCFITFVVLCVMASKHKKYGGKKPNRSLYELTNTHDYDDCAELLASTNENHVTKSTSNGYFLQVKNRASAGNGSDYSRVAGT